jgi:pilus assembly protein CpaF
VNVLVSGGTGSGKTTMLNCLTRYIERASVLSPAKMPANCNCSSRTWCVWKRARRTLKASGEVTMRDLVKNCLRMRPERIIVGEVRGPEAFDLACRR